MSTLPWRSGHKAQGWKMRLCFGAFHLNKEQPEETCDVGRRGREGLGWSLPQLCVIAHSWAFSYFFFSFWSERCCQRPGVLSCSVLRFPCWTWCDRSFRRAILGHELPSRLPELTLKYQFLRLENGLAVESTCFSTGPEFDPENLHQLAHSCL